MAIPLLGSFAVLPFLERSLLGWCVLALGNRHAKEGVGSVSVETPANEDDQPGAENHRHGMHDDPFIQSAPGATFCGCGNERLVPPAMAVNRTADQPYKDWQ